jgi:uncharacterized membrane protein YeiH
MEHALFVLVDLLGTFAFAISGAAAAIERRLDLFGVYAVAFMTACGGGIVRDLCLGAVPPVGLSDWRYLACSAVAATMTLWAGHWVERLKHPVAFFDSFGLGFFAVGGAHRALVHGANTEAAIVLGVVTAVGGGVMRDVLLTRVPVILAKEIYALAALVAAAIQVVAELNGWSIGLTPWFAAGACFGVRFLALRYSWGLPVLGRPSGEEAASSAAGSPRTPGPS